MDVVGIAGEDWLNGALGADDDVRVDNVGRVRASEHEADGGCIGTVEVNEIGARLANEA